MDLTFSHVKGQFALEFWNNVVLYFYTTNELLYNVSQAVKLWQELG